MERIDAVRATIDGLIERMNVDNKDAVLLRRVEFINSYGTASFSRLLAIKRGVDPEISAIAGHLVNIGRIVHDTEDASQYILGALEAERYLRKSSLFSETEISLICNAIKSFAEKPNNEPYSQILKDAFLLDKYFRNMTENNWGPDQKTRINEILGELGIRKMF